MIFWSRMGFLVFVFMLAASGLVMITLNSLFGQDFYGTHPWAIGFGPILGGLLSSAVGFAIRPRGGRKVIDAKTRKSFILKEPDHTFMFIPMHWAGLVVAGIGVFMFVGGFFVPPSKAVVERQARERAQAQAPAGVANVFPPRGFPQNPAAVPNIFPPRGVVPNPAPAFNPEALDVHGDDPAAAQPPAVAAQPQVAVQAPVAAEQPAPAAAQPPAAAARPPAAVARNRDAPDPISEEALANAPPDSRPLREGEKLEVGTRVLANRAFDTWEVAVVDFLPEDGLAHIDILRLGDAFNETLGYDRIRIPLPLEEIDPAMLTTITYELFPGAVANEKTLAAAEASLLKQQGYIPESLKNEKGSRYVSITVVRDSWSAKFARMGFAEAQMRVGREIDQ
ncbi:MAG: hypothetical protein JNG89_15510 [Planctomycetaceae bacterium]|nr:hypothetical protein [Planctomycetaceae bacterium]